MNRVVVPLDVLPAWRDRLLASNLETAALALARPVRTADGVRLLIFDMEVAPDEAYIKRQPDFIELAPEFLARIWKRARNDNASVVLMHTHPFFGPVAPSSTDLASEQRILPALFGRVPDGPHGRVIVGKSGVHAAVFWTADREDEVRLLEVGSRVRVLSPSTRGAVDVDMVGRFERQVRALGVEGQAELSALRVGIVGLGGIGSVVAQQLAFLGLRDFILIDPDRLDTTNLNRVVGAGHPDIGALKTDVAARMLTSMSEGVSALNIADSVLTHNVVRKLLDVDLFFCCTDSQGSRAVLNQFAYQYLVPCIDVGVRIDVAPDISPRVTGRVQMLSPGLPCLLCSDVLDPDAVRRDLMSPDERASDPYIVGATVRQPAVISINSTVASLGVTMLLGIVTDLDIRTRYQIARLEEGVVRSVAATPRPHCIVCSRNGAVGRGDAWDLPGRLT
jgi:molybdopterin/thiamine biosynthesis adenylyltransferase/proteasome lid subunit RPN8/RPN11